MDDHRTDDLIRRNHELIAEARRVCQAIHDQAERARRVRYQFQIIRLHYARSAVNRPRHHEGWDDDC